MRRAIQITLGIALLGVVLSALLREIKALAMDRRTVHPRGVPI